MEYDNIFSPISHTPIVQYHDRCSLEPAGAVVSGSGFCFFPPPILALLTHFNIVPDLSPFPVLISMQEIVNRSPLLFLQVQNGVLLPIGAIIAQLIVGFEIVKSRIIRGFIVRFSLMLGSCPKVGTKLSLVFSFLSKLVAIDLAFMPFPHETEILFKHYRAGNPVTNQVNNSLPKKEAKVGS